MALPTWHTPAKRPTCAGARGLTAEAVCPLAGRVRTSAAPTVWHAPPSPHDDDSCAHLPRPRGRRGEDHAARARAAAAAARGNRTQTSGPAAERGGASTPPPPCRLAALRRTPEQAAGCDDARRPARMVFSPSLRPSVGLKESFSRQCQARDGNRPPPTPAPPPPRVGRRARATTRSVPRGGAVTQLRSRRQPATSPSAVRGEGGGGHWGPLDDPSTSAWGCSRAPRARGGLCLPGTGGPTASSSGRGGGGAPMRVKTARLSLQEPPWNALSTPSGPRPPGRRVGFTRAASDQPGRTGTTWPLSLDSHHRGCFHATRYSGENHFSPIIEACGRGGVSEWVTRKPFTVIRASDETSLGKLGVVGVLWSQSTAPLETLDECLFALPLDIDRHWERDGLTSTKTQRGTRLTVSSLPRRAALGGSCGTTGTRLRHRLPADSGCAGDRSGARPPPPLRPLRVAARRAGRGGLTWPVLDNGRARPPLIISTAVAPAAAAGPPVAPRPPPFRYPSPPLRARPRPVQFHWFFSPFSLHLHLPAPQRVVVLYPPWLCLRHCGGVAWVIPRPMEPIV